MIGIVAHTKRAEQAHELMESVGAAYLSMDNGIHGCERNHYRTWEWLKDFAHTEWAVVLEDDAKPVDDFRQQLEEALNNAPTPIVSLYLGKQRPPHWQSAVHQAVDKAAREDACYITGTHLLHAVGVAIKTDLIADMLTHSQTTQHPWDYRIAAWALESGHKITYTFPSLVNHKDQNPVVKHPDGKTRTPGRTAWKAGTRTYWTPKAVTL
jgi:GR25 family glycosyltransferase involved in LPS biosynthesis